MHERAISVNLDPEIEADCIHDLSLHCSDLTAKSEVCRVIIVAVFIPPYGSMGGYLVYCVCLFVCLYGYRFLSGGKDRGMKLRMLI